MPLIYYSLNISSIQSIAILDIKNNEALEYVLNIVCNDIQNISFSSRQEEIIERNSVQLVRTLESKEKPLKNMSDKYIFGKL